MAKPITVVTLVIERVGTGVLTKHENVPFRAKQFVELDVAMATTYRKTGLTVDRCSYNAFGNFMFDVADLCVTARGKVTHSVVIGDHTYKATLTTEELK